MKQSVTSTYLLCAAAAAVACGGETPDLFDDGEAFSSSAGAPPLQAAAGASHSSRTETEPHENQSDELADDTDAGAALPKSASGDGTSSGDTRDGSPTAGTAARDPETNALPPTMTPLPRSSCEQQCAWVEGTEGRDISFVAVDADGCDGESVSARAYSSSGQPIDGMVGPHGDGTPCNNRSLARGVLKLDGLNRQRVLVCVSGDDGVGDVELIVKSGPECHSAFIDGDCECDDGKDDSE